MTGYRRAVLAGLWTAVVALVLLGLVASAGRGFSVYQLLRSPQSERPELSPYDSASFAIAIPLYGAQPRTARYAEIEADTRRMVRTEPRPLALRR